MPVVPFDPVVKNLREFQGMWSDNEDGFICPSDFRDLIATGLGNFSQTFALSRPDELTTDSLGLKDTMHFGWIIPAGAVQPHYFLHPAGEMQSSCQHSGGCLRSTGILNSLTTKGWVWSTGVGIACLSSGIYWLTGYITGFAWNSRDGEGTVWAGGEVGLLALPGRWLPGFPLRFCNRGSESTAENRETSHLSFSTLAPLNRGDLIVPAGIRDDDQADYITPAGQTVPRFYGATGGRITAVRIGG